MDKQKLFNTALAQVRKQGVIARTISTHSSTTCYYTSPDGQAHCNVGANLSPATLAVVGSFVGDVSSLLREYPAIEQELEAQDWDDKCWLRDFQIVHDNSVDLGGYEKAMAGFAYQQGLTYTGPAA